MTRRLMAPPEEAVVEWLLTFAVWDEQRAVEEWAAEGLTLMRCGGKFCAIRVPVPLVEAAADSRIPAEVDAYLAEAVQGAPVIRCNTGQWVYVLVRSSVAKWW